MLYQTSNLNSAAKTMALLTSAAAANAAPRAAAPDMSAWMAAAAPMGGLPPYLTSAAAANVAPRAAAPDMSAWMAAAASTAGLPPFYPSPFTVNPMMLPPARVPSAAMMGGHPSLPAPLAEHYAAMLRAAAPSSSEQPHKSTPPALVLISPAVIAERKAKERAALLALISENTGGDDGVTVLEVKRSSPRPQAKPAAADDNDDAPARPLVPMAPAKKYPIRVGEKIEHVGDFKIQFVSHRLLLDNHAIKNLGIHYAHATNKILYAYQLTLDVYAIERCEFVKVNHIRLCLGYSLREKLVAGENCFFTIIGKKNCLVGTVNYILESLSLPARLPLLFYGLMQQQLNSLQCLFPPAKTATDCISFPKSGLYQLYDEGALIEKGFSKYEDSPGPIEAKASFKDSAPITPAAATFRKRPAHNDGAPTNIKRSRYIAAAAKSAGDAPTHVEVGDSKRSAASAALGAVSAVSTSAATLFAGVAVPPQINPAQSRPILMPPPRALL